MNQPAHVYILANTFKHLYIGVTSKLEHRIDQHKDHTFPNSFTSRYRINQLVYLERFNRIETAIAREKQLKRWSRSKKITLILATNPTWQDLSAEWGKPIELHRETLPLDPTKPCYSTDTPPIAAVSLY